MDKLLDRFLRYVKVDTQSQHYQDNVPSTAKQLTLSKMLAQELLDMGASDVSCDKHGYVYATIPANNSNSNYTLGFIAHVDTSDAVSGHNVQPIITNNYDGQDIVLSGQYVLSPSQFEHLNNHIGKTIISSDGSTLLGADDKAGVAAIMTLASILLTDKSIAHGTVKIAFTPDEEVGRGTDYFDVKHFGCDGAYTVDGGEVGELEYENFNAASARVTINGVSVHPGSAKGKMINASMVLLELQSMLPVFDNPMYTEGYEGFFMLVDVQGCVDSCQANYIIRDHDKQKFLAKKEYFASCVQLLQQKWGKDTITCNIADSYYNMKENILPHMHLVDNAKQAMINCGVTPLVRAIRGGTDGAALSYKGLPCPNIFTGGYNFHGRYEYIPLEDMQKAVDVILEIVKIYNDYQ